MYLFWEFGGLGLAKLEIVCRGKIGGEGECRILRSRRLFLRV